ncbi:hypothetical protein RFF05_07200 [Bengtsoniella intestinalis]|uniref:hypothetical protein n=1 Tax=Bengtsoniella intestinalis TaxID=3073143 RepID=UPI00391EE905
MKSYYEDELRSIFEGNPYFTDVQFEGHKCRAKVTPEVEIVAEFLLDVNQQLAYGLKAQVIRKGFRLPQEAQLQFSEVPTLKDTFGAGKIGFPLSGQPLPNWPRRAPTPEQYQSIAQGLQEKVQDVYAPPTLHKVTFDDLAPASEVFNFADELLQGRPSHNHIKLTAHKDGRYTVEFQTEPSHVMALVGMLAEKYPHAHISYRWGTAPHMRDQQERNYHGSRLPIEEHHVKGGTPKKKKGQER